MKLKWYQYSLRSLMIFVLLFAFACSWFAVKWKQALHQKEIVDQIKNGRVSYAYPHFFGMPPPEWLRELCGEDFFGSVESMTGGCDADLERIKNFSQIQFLYLAETDVSNAGLKNIRNLSRIRELSLDQTNIDDNGLECLKELKHLRALFLTCTKISDAGLNHLEGLDELEVLDLRGTKISGEGLKLLQRNRNLRIVLLDPEMLRENNIAEDHVRHIKKSLPDLRIEICVGRHGRPEPEYEEWLEQNGR